jgi:hypothetical protein
MNTEEHLFDVILGQAVFCDVPDIAFWFLIHVPSDIVDGHRLDRL